MTNASINFQEIYSLLSEHQTQNSTLILPLNNPTLHRIIDLLTSYGIEKIAEQRWNAMIQRIEEGDGKSLNDEEREWLEFQSGGYLRYEVVDADVMNADDDEKESSENSDVEKFVKGESKEDTVDGAEQSKRNETEAQNAAQLAVNTEADQGSQSQSIENAKKESAQETALVVSTGDTKQDVTQPSEQTFQSGSKKDTANKSEDSCNTSSLWKQRPNHLTPARYARLKNVGVATNKWEKRFLELRQFHADHGHCNVPIDHPEGLGIWVATQRVSYRFDKATMPQGRIDALDAMGFTWQSQKRKDAWSRYFDELVEYIKNHGTSHVSAYDSDHAQLGSWVKRQRAEYQKYQTKGRTKSQMTKERIDKLEGVGFQWRLKPEKRITWSDRFEALKQYKMVHGHCRPSLSENSELNTWSRYQRLNYQYFIEGKPSRLNQDKVDKLLSIGINEPANPDGGMSETDMNVSVPEIPPHEV